MRRRNVSRARIRRSRSIIAVRTPASLRGPVQRRRDREERDRLEPVDAEGVPEGVRGLAPRQGHAHVELREQLMACVAHVALRFVDRGDGVTELDPVLQRHARPRQSGASGSARASISASDTEIVVDVPVHQEPHLILQILDHPLDVEELRLGFRHELPRPEHVELRHQVGPQLGLGGGQQLPGVLQRRAERRSVSSRCAISRK